MLILVCTGVLLLGIGAIVLVPGLRWRTQVLGLAAAGRIPDLQWPELLHLISPSSSQSIARLVDTHNPYAVIRNPHASSSDVDAGKQVFRERCAVCHAPDATGGAAAPALIGRALTHGASDWALYRTIRYGVPNTAMPAHQSASMIELWQTVAFLRALQGASQKTETHALDPTIAIDVPYDELKAMRKPGRDWLTYSGSYSGTRISTLRQIDRGNVQQLALRWMHQFEGNPDMVQCSPLVRDGVMFVTVPPGRVIAFDAHDGHQLWTFDPPPPPPVTVPLSEAVNRGVALLGDKIFVGTWDARLIALSASKGKLLWETRVEESTHHWISAAPLAYKDLVVVGTGAKAGRGVIRAYDAATGKERWSFEAIPPPGTPHHDSWAGDSWEKGGAPTWMTGTYDPESDLLFWGIGNPKPDYDASSRHGDNLYSNSVVALKGATGKLAWHFQFTPGDDHDWDSNQIPVLADVESPTGLQKLLLLANRNGFYYVLDRNSGAFVNAAPFARQTWTAGIDAQGRPIPLPASEADGKGRMIYPSNIGATNWWPPSYDPQLGLFFVPVLEHGMVFFPSVNSFPADTNQPYYTALRALNVKSGEIVWEHRHPPRREGKVVGGLLATESGLLFGGDRQSFFALDARSGDSLWSVETGGRIVAAPITYEAHGEQYIVIAAGQDLLAFALPAAPRATDKIKIAQSRDPERR